MILQNICSDEIREALIRAIFRQSIVPLERPSTAQRLRPMPTQRIPIRPERFLHRHDQRALVQGEQVAGDVVVRGERFGGNDLIAM